MANPVDKIFGFGPGTRRHIARIMYTPSHIQYRNLFSQGSRLAQESFQWLKEAKFTKNAWQIERADAIKPVANELGCSMAQLAIAWCLKNKNVSTVVWVFNGNDQRAWQIYSLAYSQLLDMHALVDSSLLLVVR